MSNTLSNEITHSDIIDSRDVIDRIEELEEEQQEALDADGGDSDGPNISQWESTGAGEELDNLRALAAEASDYAEDWEYGEALIHVDHFTDYAKELATDCAMVPEGAAWPLRHIDWEAAAEELKNDYTEVTFAGQTYYIR